MISNLHEILLEDKRIILIGTAHVSKNSVVEVKEIIEKERPDSVCVELDKSRYNSIINKEAWGNTDILSIIKSKKSLVFMVKLVLASYQRRLANKLGIQPGQEMIQGIESAKEVEAELILADRDIEITMKRILASLSPWDKLKLLSEFILGIFLEEEITEEDIDRMKSEDMLEAALSELTKKNASPKNNPG